MKVMVTDEESRLSIRMTFISLTDRKHIQAMRTVPNMHQASSGPYYRNAYVAWNNETAESWTYYTDAPLGKHHRKGVCPVYMSVQRIKAVWQDGRTNVLHNVGQGDSVDMSEGKEKDTVHSDMYMQWNILKDNHNNYPLQPPPTKNSKCNENKLVETFVQRSI